MAATHADKKPRPSISAVLPAYNEEANIEGAGPDVTSWPSGQRS